MKRLVLVMVVLFNILLFGEDGEKLLEEGKYQVEVGNFEKGKIDLEEYLRVGDDPEAYVYLARAKRELGDLRGANSTIKPASEKYLENSDIYLERVEVLRGLLNISGISAWRKEEYKKEYYESYERYLELINYQDADAIYTLGNEYFIDGYFEKANNIFVKDQSESIKNLFGAATTYRFLSNYKKAINYYNMIIERDPNFTEAYLGRGSAYELSGNLTLGISDMKRYLEYNKDLDVYIAVANMYMSEEKYSSAKDILEEASTTYPSSKDIREMLIEVYSKLKR